MARFLGDAKEHGPIFIPCTREIEIGRSVVYRPVRMWHSGTYAGEGFTSVRGDGSGCLKRGAEATHDHHIAPRPSSVVTRLYWNRNKPARKISALLSYPGGMGCVDEYFWEATIESDTDGITRWTGDNAEAEMEEAIRQEIGDGVARSDVQCEPTNV